MCIVRTAVVRVRQDSANDLTPSMGISIPLQLCCDADAGTAARHKTCAMTCAGAGKRVTRASSWEHQEDGIGSALGFSFTSLAWFVEYDVEIRVLFATSRSFSVRWGNGLIRCWCASGMEGGVFWISRVVCSDTPFPFVLVFLSQLCEFFIFLLQIHTRRRR